MEFNIYALGSHEFMVRVLNAIGSLWGDNSSFIWGAIGAGAILGLMFGALSAIQDERKSPIKDWVYGLIAFFALGSPAATTTVTVWPTAYAASEVSIDNIPLFIAVPAWLATSVLRSTATHYENAFGSVTGAGGTQYLDPYRAMVAVTRLGGSLSMHNNVDASITNYFNDCVFPAQKMEMVGAPPIDITTVIIGSDLWESQQVTSNSIGTYVSLYGNTQYMGCHSAFNALSMYFASSDFKNDIDGKIVSLAGTDPDAIDQFINSLSNGAVVTVERYKIVRDALVKQIKQRISAGKNTDFLSESAMFDAKMQRHYQMSSDRSLWLELGMALMTFFESLAYYFAPIIAMMLVLTGNGPKAVIQVLLVIVWVNMWPLGMIAVNAFTDSAISGRLGPFDGAMTYGMFEDSMTTIESYIAVASTLTAMIPSIALFLIYRGVHTMMGIANKATPDTSIDAKRMSPDTLTAANGGSNTIGDNRAVASELSNGQISVGGGGASNNIDRYTKNFQTGITGAQEIARQSVASAEEAKQVVESRQRTVNEQFGKTLAATNATDAFAETKSTLGETHALVNAAANQIMEKVGEGTSHKAAVNAAIDAGVSAKIIGVELAAQLRSEYGLTEGTEYSKVDKETAQNAFSAALSTSDAVRVLERSQNQSQVAKTATENEQKSTQYSDALKTVQSASEAERYSSVLGVASKVNAGDFAPALSGNTEKIADNWLEKLAAQPGGLVAAANSFGLNPKNDTEAASLLRERLLSEHANEMQRLQQDPAQFANMGGNAEGIAMTNALGNLVNSAFSGAGKNIKLFDRNNDGKIDDAERQSSASSIGVTLGTLFSSIGEAAGARGNQLQFVGEQLQTRDGGSINANTDGGVSPGFDNFFNTRKQEAKQAVDRAEKKAVARSDGTEVYDGNPADLHARNVAAAVERAREADNGRGSLSGRYGPPKDLVPQHLRDITNEIKDSLSTDTIQTIASAMAAAAELPQAGETVAGLSHEGSRSLIAAASAEYATAVSPEDSKRLMLSYLRDGGSDLTADERSLAQAMLPAFANPSLAGHIGQVLDPANPNGNTDKFEIFRANRANFEEVMRELNKDGDANLERGTVQRLAIASIATNPDIDGGTSAAAKGLIYASGDKAAAEQVWENLGVRQTPDQNVLGYLDEKLNGSRAYQMVERDELSVVQNEIANAAAALGMDPANLPVNFNDYAQGVPTGNQVDRVLKSVEALASGKDSDGRDLLTFELTHLLNSVSRVEGKLAEYTIAGMASLYEKHEDNPDMIRGLDHVRGMLLRNAPEGPESNHPDVVFGDNGIPEQKQ